MKKEVCKRLLCGLLVVSLCLSNMNFNVYAADDADTSVEVSTEATTEDTSKKEEPAQEQTQEEVQPESNTTAPEEEKTEAKKEQEKTESTEKKEEEKEASDLSDKTDRILAACEKWWYEDADGKKRELEATTRDHEISYDLTAAAGSEKGGFDFVLDFQKNGDDRAVTAGDYLVFHFPDSFKNLKIESCDNDFYDYSIKASDDDSYKVTITFKDIPAKNDLKGCLHFTYSLADTLEKNAGKTIKFELQKLTTYQIIIPENNTTENTANDSNEADPIYKAEEDPVMLAGSEEEPESVAGVETFSLSGNIEYSGETTADGTDWTGLTRPDEFDQKVKIQFTYADGDGVTRTKTLHAQKDNEENACYLIVNDDGSGAGTYTLSNIPKTVTEDENTYQVTGYIVSVDTDLPYYTSNEIAISTSDIPSENQVSDKNLSLTLKTSEVKLQPTVDPSEGNEDVAFTMTAAITNNVTRSDGTKVSITDEDRSMSLTASPTPASSVTYQVPVGLLCCVEETPAEGYGFIGEYTVKVNNTNSYTNEPSVTIASDTNYVITAKNYPLVTGTFYLSGNIDYAGEIAGGIDWSDMTRPSAFDQKVKIKITYVDYKGITRAKICYAQEDIEQNDFYLKINHDGSGEGAYTITNIPRTVTVDEKTYQVTGYTISVDTDLPYYSSSEITVSENEILTASQAIGDLCLTLQTSPLTIKPVVVPEEGNENVAFTMTTTIINNVKRSDGSNVSIGDEDRKIIKTESATETKSLTYQVPVGLAYSVVETPTEGYKFAGQYTITKTYAIGFVDENTSEEAVGTMENNRTDVVTAKNYAQNIRLEFDTEWIDNNKVGRPSLTSDNFILEYKTDEEGSEWTELTSDKLEELGISAMPGFDDSKADAGVYYYTNLPAVNASEENLTYRVRINSANVPDGYVAREVEGTEVTTFSFDERTNFTAQIQWNDDSNAEIEVETSEGTETINPRPDSLSSLNLYRRIGTGNYELVRAITEDDITKTAGSNVWTVNISNLSRYDSGNHEYDYVLVNGTIDENNNVTAATVDYYTAYVDNGTGSYGNDTDLCHNGSKITEVLTTECDFSAKKVWKDPEGTEKTRPTATMTLWRYVASDATDIDSAYLNGKAAQVTFYNATTDSYDNILSYDIDTSGDKDIVFNYTTVSGLSNSYVLPGNDDQGRRYVYFVREVLTGNNKNNYDVTYTDKDGNVLQQGASNGGTITNTRREKAAISVTKVWQDPSGLTTIADSVVQLKLYAKTAEEGSSYEELVLYSDEQDSYEHLSEADKTASEKVSGFSESISTSDTTYYVNIYNSDGVPYDMSTAKISEIITKGTEGDADYQQVEVPYGQSSLTFAGKNYVAASSYLGVTTLSDGTKEYRYRQTNTIYETRSYTLIKVWNTSIADEDFADVTSVNFVLKRRSLKENSTYETVGTYYQVARVDGDRTWQSVINGLDKYDAEGYEYYYMATEVSFNLDDETTITNSVRGWGSDHHRTPEQTKVYNYKGGTGSPYFTVSKIWTDNGDSENRKNVILRVYDREHLLAALGSLQSSTGASDSDIVDLDQIGNYHTATLTEDNDSYTDEIYMNDAFCNETGTSEDSDKTDWKKYIVVEYMVGSSSDGATAGQYTYAQLKTAATKTVVTENDTINYSYTGKISNSNRAYKVNTAIDTSSRTVIITNTRTGITSISAGKQWNDGSDETGNRPDSIKFQLMQDGVNYEDIPSDVTITGDGASLNYDTGVITVSSDAGATGNNWGFTINNLPMFSDSAIAHYYTMDEVAATAGDTNVSYLQRKTNVNAVGTGKSMNYTFNYENTITGSIQHVAYKYWDDVSVSASNRPDLYLTLYRYLKSDAQSHPETKIENLSSYKAITDCKDQVWTSEPEDHTSQEYTDTYASDYEHGYNWKITVSELPMFDASGNEYVYVFKESMNNSGKTVLGTYIQGEETKTVDNDEGTYDVFTNTITDYMTVSGTKTWTGFSGYFTKESYELPDPEITLYRTTDKSITNLQDKTDDQIEELVENGTIVKIDTTTLTNKHSSYKFPDSSDVSEEEISNGYIKYVEDGSGSLVPMLPKYDAEGNKYIYLVHEIVSNGSDEAAQIKNSLYTELNSNGTLQNVFRSDVNRRKITVTKTWDGRYNLRDAEKKYHSVTYHLYRYILGQESTTTEEIGSIKINANEFSDTDGSASCTFSDLLVYSPAGQAYGYYITEDTIDGYSVTYQEDENEDHTNDRIDVTSIPSTWADENADNETQVGTKNTYQVNSKIQLTGNKIWNDYSNMEGFRPDGITFILTRKTSNESGQTNAVSSETIDLKELEAVSGEETEPYIVWDKTTDSNKWSYTVYNLERFAPNGMPYVYTFSEEKQDNYVGSGAVSKTAGDGNKLSNVTNGFSGTYYVRKEWEDGYDVYNLRPSSITLKLERSNDGGTTWNTIEWKDSYGTYNETTKKWTGLPSVMSEDGTKIVSIELTAANVKKNTRNKTWEYTFTNLPLKDKDGNTYKYRCVEVKIGSATIESSGTGDDAKLTAGSYECVYDEQSDTQTYIENKLNKTSLVVNKIWEGDEDNLYESRPDSVQFVLQKKGVIVRNDGDAAEDTELTQWQNVMLSDNTPYTFTISKDENWTKTLDNLPIAQMVNGDDDNSYTLYSLYFRAVEVHSEGTNLTKGALNYEDETDYSDTSKDHKYVTDHNVSNITNKLLTDETQKTITFSKRWFRSEGDAVTAEFELQYRVQGTEDWSSIKKTDGTTTTGLLQEYAATKSESKTFTWTNLPKYDREGNELEYQVIEHPVSGYATDMADNESLLSPTEYATEYFFANTELQTYTVEKIWKKADYAHAVTSGDDEGLYTATFVLQKQVEGDDTWTTVEGSEITLKTDQSGSTATEDLAESQKHTWTNLPKYMEGSDGSDKKITYRAVETKINGISVADNSNGQYIVTYDYDSGSNEPAFEGTVTLAENRMVYGFVNLSKAAAYLAPAVTAAGKSLAGVTFDIYDSDDNLYVSNVKTDENGNLIYTGCGKYGDEAKYLITGTYTLKEASTGDDYSLWKNGVTFTVSDSSSTGTGEHGTAWIATDKTLLTNQDKLVVTYLAPSTDAHSYEDSCVETTSADAPAYNVESRGVLTFTKTGPDSAALDTHTEYDTATVTSTGESDAYFAVYIVSGTDDEGKNNYTQVAGMKADTDKKTFILTNKDKDGNAITVINNPNGIPYLRSYRTGFTLLSGTYYIKEIVAPAGYELDDTMRKAVIAKITETDTDADLSGVYASNAGRIMATTDTIGTDSYEWENTPNVVKICKKDQYGRDVTLNENQYLELKVSTGTFKTGEDTIRLYQSSSAPATKKDGTTAVGGITYADGSWTITGLFDAEKTYTLSEPAAAVPKENIVAESVGFTMETDGSVTVTSDADKTAAKEDPAAVINNNGDDYINYYKSGTDENVILLRDVSRYLVDVSIKKQDSKTNDPIQYISFELHKYDSTNEDGTFNNDRSVLEDGVVLTTNASGQIVISEQDDGIKNVITGSDLKYGLDMGNYYLQEVEKGASDSYRLSGKIFFTVKSANPANPTSYDDFAEVTFTTSDHVSQDSSSHLAVIKNDPVTTKNKTLKLQKVDDDDSSLIAGAVFMLYYTSKTNAQDGSSDTAVYTCKTGSDGYLYLVDEDGSVTSVQPDISKKGSYVLKETQAADTYMTRTEEGSAVTMASFSVDSDNKITNVSCYDDLVASHEVASDSDGENIRLDLTVKNEKTVVSVSKRNDISENTKTSDEEDVTGEKLNGSVLEIYEGISTTGTPVITLDDDHYYSSITKNWSVPEGTLKENTVYTLHEKTAPAGFMKASDIYFKLSGTTVNSGSVISKIYVWTGSEAPSGISGSTWSETKNLSGDVLTMVDEAMIAPVNMQKVRKASDNTYAALEGAVFSVTSLDDNTVLGTAKTDEDGYLVWDTVDSGAYEKGLIYTTGQKRATSTDTLTGTAIILRTNTSGYRFTETSAPDNAYNAACSYDVTVTKDNYLAYKNGGYTLDQYINILSDGDVTDLTDKDSDDKTATENDLVNPYFEAAFELYKYDEEDPDINADHNNYDAIGLSGVTFTLYKQKSDGTYPSTGTEYVTGENGLLHINLAEKGTYKLVETKSRTGYVYDNTVKTASERIFTITNDDYQKTLTYSGTADNHTAVIKDTDGTETGIATADFANARQHGTVTLTKKDDGTKELLNGVTYLLKRTSPAVNTQVDRYFPSETVTEYEVTTGKTYENLAVAGSAGEITVTTGSDGVLTIKDLQWGTYTLTEKTENAGYVNTNPVYEFTISADSLTKTVTDTGKEYVANKKNQLTVFKTALDGTTQLSGATFSLYKVTEGKMVDSATEFYTSADKTTKGTVITAGKTTVYGLTKGTYVLRELTAPDGYELTEDVVFTMNTNGTITDVANCTVGTDGTVTAKTTSGFVTSGSDNTLTVKDTPIEVSLKKTDADDTTTGLSGAQYQIIGTKFAATALKAQETKNVTTKDDGKTYITLASKTDSNGSVSIPSALLVAGCDYTIHEVTAPDGFEIGEDVTITVNTDGTVTEKSDSGDHATIASSNTEVVLSDEPIEVTLDKTFIDSTDMALSEGAVFSLTPAAGSAFADTVNGNAAKTDGLLVKADGSLTDTSAECSGCTKTANTVYLHITVTNGNGTILIPKGVLKQENGYVLTEVMTSTGYQIDSADKITFTVGTDGKVTFTEVTDDATTFTGTKTDKISINNSKIQFSVIKVSDDTTSEYNLDDVKLTLTKVNSTGTSTEEYSLEWDNATAKKEFKGWAAGWYKLSETNRPAGYLQAADMYFKVNQDNSVQRAILKEGELKVYDSTEDTGVTVTGTIEAQTDGNYLVTMPNTLIRGGVSLNKIYSDTKKAVKDAVFSLYKQTGNTPDSENDVLIVKNIRTDADGNWDSSKSTLSFESGAYTLEGVSGTDKISLGLTVGTYYFKETDCDTTYVEAVKDNTYTFTITDAVNNINSDSDHGKVVVLDGDTSDDTSTSITNTPFKTTVKLWKTEDSAHSYTNIKDAVFTLYYKGTFDSSYRVYGEYTTDSNGVLTASLDRKGAYYFVEKTNEGYTVESTHYTFTIGEDSYDKTLYLNQNGTSGELNYKNESDEFYSAFVDTDSAKGSVENTRKPGSIKLKKVDKDDTTKTLNGVTFALYYRGSDGNKTGDKLGTYTTANGGVIEITNLDWNSYILIEESTISGYKIGPKISFDINRQNVDAGGFTYDFTSSDKVVTNEQNVLVINKLNSDKSSITDIADRANAYFAVYETKADGTADTSKVAATGTTSGGTLTIKGKLTGGQSYILRETRAPEGYELSKDVPFTMGTDGVITWTAADKPDSADLTAAALATNTDTNKTYTDYSTYNVIDVQDTKISVSLTKTDLNGNALSGETFSVTGTFATKTADDFKDKTLTELSSELTGELIAGNDYVITETTAPEGYELITIKIHVNSDGTVSNQTVIGGSGDVSVDTTGTAITIKDTPIEIAFKKVGTNDQTIGLSGAAYQLTGIFAGKTTEETKDLTVSVATGKITIDPAQVVANRTYTLHEVTAPKGYEVAQQDVSVSVKTDGTVTVTGTNASAVMMDSNAKVSEDGTVVGVQVADYPTTIKINKTNAEDSSKDKLSGAQFNVTGTFAKTTTGSISITVNKDDEITALTGELIVGNTYTFTETKAPEGYEMTSPALSFKILVNDDGTYSLLDDSNQSTTSISGVAGATGSSDTVSVYNKPIEVSLMKVDTASTSTKLYGAVYSITGRFAGKTTGETRSYSDTKSGTNDGLIEIETAQLVAGETYTVKELTAPDGYEIGSDISFKVKEDGTVELKDTYANAAVVTLSDEETQTVGGSSVAIRMSDIAISAKIKKVDEDNTSTGLAGAQFTLEPADGYTFAKTPDNSSTSAGKTIVTLTTGSDGSLMIQDGILTQNSDYILKETKSVSGYYLSNAARDGVTIHVNTDGSLVFADGKTHTPFTIATVTDSKNSKDSTVSVTNKKTTKFSVTKDVTGNMGDLNGSFEIQLKVYEADGTVGKAADGTPLVQTVTLTKNETVTSETVFGTDSIPVGATLELTEPAGSGYTPVVTVAGNTVSSDNISWDESTGVATVLLTSDQLMAITLTNHKNVMLDVGVHTDNQIPWAMMTFLLPAAWMTLRYRKRRREGGM